MSDVMSNALAAALLFALVFLALGFPLGYWVLSLKKNKAVIFDSVRRRHMVAEERPAISSRYFVTSAYVALALLIVVTAINTLFPNQGEFLAALKALISSSGLFDR